MTALLKNGGKSQALTITVTMMIRMNKLRLKIAVHI
jgi:hypothetical protein